MEACIRTNCLHKEIVITDPSEPGVTMIQADQLDFDFLCEPLNNVYP